MNMTVSLKELWTVSRDHFRKFQQAELIAEPEIEARWILSSLLDVSAADFIINRRVELSFERIFSLKNALRRRIKGEPLAYILCEHDFCGEKFVITNDVLIPRADTEQLALWAISKLKTKAGDLRVLDLGTGSGCLAVTIAKAFPDVKVTALDISAAALEVAHTNAQVHAVAARVEFKSADACLEAALEESLKGQMFDLIVANPPYLDPSDAEVGRSVRDFEPALALFSSEEGYFHIRQWLDNALSYLKPGGFMGFEIGHKQAVKVHNLFSQTNAFISVYTEKDLAGRDRIIWAQRG